MLERLDGADEERAVADGNHDVGRDTAELLEGLVDVGLHAFVEVRVVDVVGVVRAAFGHLRAA